MSKKNLREDVYKIIESDWPIHISGIARKLGLPVDGKDKKKIVARINYHVKLLKEEEKILTKKIDRALVIWPHDVEKIRFVHEILK